MWLLQDPGPPSSLLSQPLPLCFMHLSCSISPTHFCPWPFGPQPCTLLKFIPNLKVSYLDRDILDLVWLVRNWPAGDGLWQFREETRFSAAVCWKASRVWPDPEVMPPPHPPSITPVHSPWETQGRLQNCDWQIRHHSLPKDGHPGRYHPVTLSCLAPRSMIPSASTQKTSKGGHLWLLFPSQQVPGEGIGHLR